MLFFNNIRRGMERLTFSLLLAAGLACMQSCIYEDEDWQGITPLEPAETLYLQLKVSPGSSSGYGTRAVSDDPFDKEDHPQEEGLDIENRISFNDIKLLLFNSSSGVLLQELVPMEQEEDQRLLTFTAEVTVSPTLITSSGGTVSFTVVALANWNAIGSEYPALEPMVTTIASLEQTARYIFELGSSWTPESGNGGKVGIPMYGRQTFEGISMESLRATSMQNPLPLYPTSQNVLPYQKEVRLLRSLAKVEVADNIDNKDSEGFPKVLSVALRYYVNNGLLIPLPTSFHNSYYPEIGYNQVFKTSLPEAVSISNDTKSLARKKYATSDDGYGNDWDQKFPDGWWSTYIPEMNYGAPSSVAPQLEITYQKKSSEPQLIKSVPLPQFATSEGMILRNHIYRIEVGMSSESQIILHYGICPWVEETIDIPPFD